MRVLPCLSCVTAAFREDEGCMSRSMGARSARPGEAEGVSAAKRGARFERANPSDREGERRAANESMALRRGGAEGSVKFLWPSMTGYA